VTQSKTSSPLRIALVGAGGLGQVWSKMIVAEPKAKLAAFVDPLVGTDRQSAWLAEMPDVPRFKSISTLTEPVDALVVTAFSPAHAEAIRDGLDRGLHVIVESRSSPPCRMRRPWSNWRSGRASR
jgi:predicted dehydrogenase